MELHPCPFCGGYYPEYQLNQHANSHFENHKSSVDFQELCQLAAAEDAESPKDSNNTNNNLQSHPSSSIINVAGRISLNLNALMHFQIADDQFKENSNIIPLLANCFQKQKSPYQSSTCYLSGPVHHYSATDSDSGWGCGWRNSQMLISNIQQKSAQYKQALFRGASFVPDISSLQAWLEYAWCQGFDPEGCHALNGNVQGSTKWLGTADATTILRQFGIKAQFVDFVGVNSTYHTHPIGGTTHHGISCDGCQIQPIIGIRYRSYKTEDYDLCDQCKRSISYEAHAPFEEIGVPPRHEGYICMFCNVTPIIGNRYQRNGKIKQSLCCECWSQLGYLEKRDFRAITKPEGDRRTRNRFSDHEKLVIWVWEYFSKGRTLKNCDVENGAFNEALSKAEVLNIEHANAKLAEGTDNTVIVTDMSPLYFQHNGHSRTIVGIEKVYKYTRQGTQLSYNLIILDPSTPAQKLQTALKTERNWQALLKRGLHTLKKPEYQLVFIEEGVLPQSELVSLKKLKSYSSIFA